MLELLSCYLTIKFGKAGLSDVQYDKDTDTSADEDCSWRLLLEIIHGPCNRLRTQPTRTENGTNDIYLRVQ